MWMFCWHSAWFYHQSFADVQVKVVLCHCLVHDCDQRRTRQVDPSSSLLTGREMLQHLSDFKVQRLPPKTKNSGREEHQTAVNFLNRQYSRIQKHFQILITILLQILLYWKLNNTLTTSLEKEIHNIRGVVCFCLKALLNHTFSLFNSSAKSVAQQARWEWYCAIATPPGPEACRKIDIFSPGQVTPGF